MPKLGSRRLIGPAAVVVTAAVLAFMVGTARAVHRPRPRMDYVPQETGIYDTYYDYLMEDDCRYCMGASTSERHHYNEHALTMDCTNCHIVGPQPPSGDLGVTVFRDCRNGSGGIFCHLDFRNGWHHDTYLAASDQCTACHNPQILGELAELVDPRIPGYEPTVVTPSPYDCENCHWEQLVDTVGGITHPSTDVHYDPWGQIVANYTDSSVWPGGSVMNWTPGVQNFVSQGTEWDMEVGGTVNDGWSYSTMEDGSARPPNWEKDILDNLDNHHMNGLSAVAGECDNCHAEDPGDPSYDPNDPLLIRYCERCHDILSLHRIQGHVDGCEDTPLTPTRGDGVPDVGGGSCTAETWNEFMFGNNAEAWQAAEIDGYADAEIYRAFGTNERCWGCHGQYMVDYDPPFAGSPASVSTITPGVGEPGQVVEITGTNFGEDMTEGCAIELSGAGTGGVWVKVPVVDWTDTLVSFRLPAWIFPVGNYQVRVSAVYCTLYDAYLVCQATAIGTSNLATFTVTDHPTLKDIDTDAQHPGVLFPWLGPPVDYDDGKSKGPFYSQVALTGTGGFEGGTLLDDGNPATGSVKTVGPNQIDIGDPVFAWTASVGKPGAFFCELAPAATPPVDPNLTKPRVIALYGGPSVPMGALVAGTWAWGDAEPGAGLGFKTIYIMPPPAMAPGTMADYEPTRLFSQVILSASEGSPPGGGPGGELVVADGAMGAQVWPTTGWVSGKNSIVSWSDTDIIFKLKWLWRDDNADYIQNGSGATPTEPFVAPDHVHIGDYEVRVRTIYWVDKDNDGSFDFPNPADPADPANEAMLVCTSDPVFLNLTNQPFIWKVKPRRVTKGSRVSVIGANFGDTMNDSYIEVYGKNLVQNKGTVAGSTANTVTLAGTASAVDGAYNGMSVKIVGKEVRTITNYVGATKVATVDSAWTTPVPGLPTPAVDKYKVFIPGFSLETTLYAGDGRLRGAWSATKVKFRAKGMKKGPKQARVVVGGLASEMKKFRVI